MSMHEWRKNDEHKVRQAQQKNEKRKREKHTVDSFINRNELFTSEVRENGKNIQIYVFPILFQNRNYDIKRYDERE